MVGSNSTVLKLKIPKQINIDWQAFSRRLLIGSLAVVCSLVLLREAVNTSPALRQMLANSFLGRILAVTEIPENFKLAQINDNYHRCQNKLGLSYKRRVDDIYNQSQGQFKAFPVSQRSELAKQLDREFSQIFSTGARFVYFDIQMSAASQLNGMATVAAEIAKLAKENHIKAVFNLGPEGGTAFMDRQVTLDFIRKLAETATETVEFVVTSAPRAAFEAAGGDIKNFVKLRDDADYVAFQLTQGRLVDGTYYGYTNAIVAPPLMYLTASGNCEGDSLCEKFGTDEDPFYIRTDANIFRTGEAEFNLHHYDIVMFSMQNYDYTFKLLKPSSQPDTLSKASRQAFAHFDKNIKSWIKAYNDQNVVTDASKRNQKEMQVLIVNYGPGAVGGQTTWPKDEDFANPKANVTERLGYDFGRLSDDPMVAGVIMSAEMYAIAPEFNDSLYSTLNLNGTNCNYDLVDYQKTYAEKSNAYVCEADTSARTSEKARTRFTCNEDQDLCSAKIEFTIQVGLPIRNFGSNSAIGTDTQPYMPPSPRIAGSANIPADFLNQFAGRLSPGGNGPTTAPYNFNPAPEDKADSVTIIGDSQSAPEAARGSYLPDTLFAKPAHRAAAIPGSSAKGFATEPDKQAKLDEARKSDAKYAVIMLGTNDCALGNPGEFKQHLATIASKLSGKKIMISTIPYMKTPNGTGVNCPVPVIQAYNSAIISLANENGWTLRDMTSCFTQNNMDSYLDKDGLHLGTYEDINMSTYNLIKGRGGVVCNTVNSRSGSTAPGAPTTTVPAYTMPWLGNAINSSSPGLDALNIGMQRGINLEDSLSAGSYPTFAGKEQVAESTNNPEANVWTYNGGNPGKFTLRDEVALCAGKDGCINKVLIGEINRLRNYDPVKLTTPSFISGAKCGGDIRAVNTDPQNMIYGSEQVISEVSKSMSIKEFAYEVARGRIATSWSAFLVRSGCTCLDSRDRKIPFTKANAKRCVTELSKDEINKCITNVNIERFKDYANSDAYFEADLPSAPQYKIDGAYDALAALYNNVQTLASMQGQKIIFAENWGWEADINIKAYSVVNGAGKYGIELPRKNQMLEFFQHDIIPKWNTPKHQATSSASNSNKNNNEGNQCQIGINYAIQGPGLTEAEVQKTVDYGYSHGLVMTTGTEGERQGTVNALNLMCNAGITPILRSCFTGNCAFTNGVEQANHLNQIINASSCSQVVVTCGHNEPVPENPNFARGESAAMISEGGWARDCTNILKSNSKAKVTTSVFNATHPNLEQHINDFFTGYGTFNPGDYYCLAFNTYTFVGGQKAIDYYNRIANDSRFAGMKTCIMETGVAFPSPGQTDTYTGEVVRELLNGTRGNMLFALGFNWMGTNPDPTWEHFKLSDANNEAIANCSLTGGTLGNFQIPGRYNATYNNYLAEGANWQKEKHYYKMLGFIDELNRLWDVYAFNSGVSHNVASDLLKVPPRCDDPGIQKLRDQGIKVNCIANFSNDPRSKGYIEDPLGKFLCAQGYQVVSEQCNLKCLPPDIDTTPTPGKVTNPACPVQDDKCWQGPTGNVSHYCTGGQPAFDFWNTKNEVIYAPEDGQIVYVRPNEDYICNSNGLSKEVLDKLNSARISGSAEALKAIESRNGNYADLQSAGATIYYRGNSGIFYFLTHVNINRAQAQQMSSQKPNYKGGQAFKLPEGSEIKLYHVPDEIFTPCWQGAHLHTVAKIDVPTGDILGKGGQYVDQYQLYGNILGCKSTNSCKTATRDNDKKCSPPNWVSLSNYATDKNNNNGGGNSSGVCVPGGGDNGGGNGPLLGCNEFNCDPNNPARGNFNDSLECAANTLANDVRAGKALSLVLDEYGPYCHNETLMITCEFADGKRKDNCTAQEAATATKVYSTMPFANNFMKLYNEYVPTAARCNSIPPRTPRMEDIGKTCRDFGSDFRSQSNMGWKYYRSMLDSCGADKLTWAAGSHGLSAEELTDKIINETIYKLNDQFWISFKAGSVGTAVPRDKVLAVVKAAEKRNLNPYLLIGTWATESWFGKSKPACNVY
jgi:lysophospholipase L1-like esterase